MREYNSQTKETVGAKSDANETTPNLQEKVGLSGYGQEVKDQEKLALLKHIEELEVRHRQDEVRIEKLTEENEVLKKERDILEKETMTDVLTGLTSRNGLMKMLVPILSARRQSPVETERRGGIEAREHKARPTCLLMLDIDHFKAVNDTYGHPAGDHVLKTVAERLRRCFRGVDIVARVGGEEIIVIIDGMSAETAYQVFLRKEQFANNNGTLQLGFDNIEVTVTQEDVEKGAKVPAGTYQLTATFSGGMADIGEGQAYSAGETDDVFYAPFNSAYQKADLLLFKAKGKDVEKENRNRIFVESSQGGNPS